MKAFIVFALISVLSVSAQKSPECVQYAKNAENGLRKLLLLEKDASIPKEMTDINARCKDAKDLYKNMVMYKACIKDNLQTTLYTTTLQSISKLIKENCETEANKQKALNVLKCLTPETVTDAQKCAIGSFNVIRQLANSNKAKSEIVKDVCCLTHVGADCARQKFSSVQCPNSSVPPGIYFENTMKSLSKDTIEIACEEYKSLGICEQRAPDTVKRVKQEIESATQAGSEKPFIDPILEIASKIAN